MLGIMILVGGGYAAFRALKNKGVAIEDWLKRLGVETPANTVATSFAPLKPTSVPLSPLPSLSELPIAPPAPPPAAAARVPAASVLGPALSGIGGAVAGETFDLSDLAAFTIGRDVDRDLALTSDTAISRRHALFTKTDEGWTVVDEGSSNGTFVNGVRVSGVQPLRSGDEIQIGAVRFRFAGSGG